MNKSFTAENAEVAEMKADELNRLSEAVIGAAIEVHRALGPGLLESTYEMCLCRELSLREVQFERQKPIPVEYKGIKLDCEYRADLVIYGVLLVEIKSVDAAVAHLRCTASYVSKARRLESRVNDKF